MREDLLVNNSNQLRCGSPLIAVLVQTGLKQSYQDASSDLRFRILDGLIEHSINIDISLHYVSLKLFAVLRAGRISKGVGLRREEEEAAAEREYVSLLAQGFISIPL